MSTGNFASSSSSTVRKEAAQSNPIMDKNQLKQLLLIDKNEATTPYALVHEIHYLDMITESDPQVTVRLVFLARQLPRSLAFARRMAPLRRKHRVDTFMVPNEIKVVDSDSDIIVGFLGALDRVCNALQDFLQGLAPTQRGFYVWRLCILTPPKIQSDLVKGYDPILVYDLENNWCESSIPELHSVLGRRYGPVGNMNEDDYIFTIQSCSLPSIMAAVRYIGEAIICNESVSGPRCGGFYTGGTPSRIPQALFAHTGMLAANKYEYGLLLGYLFRPEMLSQYRMLLRPFHLQVTLPSSRAVHLLRGKHLHPLHYRHKAIVEILRNTDSDDGSDHVCDIGAYTFDDIAKTVAALVDTQQTSSPDILSRWHPDSQVRVIVPCRVADALDLDETQGVVVKADARSEGVPVQRGEGRLKAREVEFTAVVKGDILGGIESGIHAVLSFMYMHD
ncbi:hypothetical protein BGZ52_006633 [Haplosporangium bisporale]|nr:hypothetical protein BGZ52_006633 [Haplosporangium bisporale]